MFAENIKIIKDTFLEFKGSGMYLALFFIAILYLYLKENDKRLKYMFIYFPLISLFITLNPIFNKIVGGVFNDEVYWRLFWILPIGITISYAIVKILNGLDTKKEKIIVSISILIIIMVSGKFIYTEENFIKVGNLYKIPDESVLVAQLIASDEGEYKKALVSENLVSHIRQIESCIMLAYSRIPQGYNENHTIVNNLRIGNVAGIAKDAYDTNSNYVVVRKDIPLNAKMEDYNFEKLNETTEYLIYKKNENNK